MNPETVTEDQKPETPRLETARTWETSDWFRRWLELVRSTSEPARA